MKINALPPYNPCKSYGLNNNKTKYEKKNNDINFSGFKLEKSTQHEIGILAALAGFASIPFIFCALAKKFLKPKDDTHQDIFLNDGTYFIHTADFE